MIPLLAASAVSLLIIIIKKLKNQSKETETNNYVCSWLEFWWLEKPELYESLVAHHHLLRWSLEFWLQFLQSRCGFPVIAQRI